MTVRSLDYLKTRFETGDYPTQTDFADWIDTMASLATEFAGIPILWVAEEADLAALIGLLDGQWVGVGTDPPGTFRRWNATDEVFEIVARPVLWVPNEAALAGLTGLADGQVVVVGTDPIGTFRQWGAGDESFTETAFQTVAAAQAAAAAAPGRVYLLTSALSDAPGSRVMSTAASTEDEIQTREAVVREESEWVEIGAWLTPQGEPGLTQFPAGTYTLTAWLHVSANTDLTNVRGRVIHQSGGLGTQIGVASVAVSSLTPTTHTLAITVEDPVTVLETDRLGLVLEAETRSLVEFVTVTLSYDGPAVTPFATPIVGEPIGRRIYPLAFYFAGTPEAGAKIRTLFVSDVVIPQGLARLQVNCDVPPAAPVDVVITLYRSGVLVRDATVTLDTDGSVDFTGVWPFDTHATAGDVLEIALPETADSTLSGLALTIRGILP